MNMKHVMVSYKILSLVNIDYLLNHSLYTPTIYR